MHTYKIVKESEDGFKFATIEKGNITAQFTLNDIEVNEDKVKRHQKEIEAQLIIENAKITNILEHNPFIKDMSEKDIHACHLYWEAHAFKQAAEPKLEEFAKLLKDSDDEKALIISTIGMANILNDKKENV